MKFLSRFDDFESIIVDGDVQSSGLSSLYIKDTNNAILRIGSTTGDSFITYDGSELSISSDVDLRLTTPTDQDVFLITSSGNISTTAGGGTFTIGGGLTLSNFGAGYLKTDANGVVSIDTDIIEDTLDSVTDRNAVTTNAITVGGLTVDTDTLYVDATNNSVGVGTTSPGYKLEVAGNIGITQSSTIAHLSGNGSGTLNINNTTGQINFLANGSTVTSMWITSSGITLNENVDVNYDLIVDGNVGIGTTSPSDKLHIKGNLRVEDGSTTSNFRLQFADENTLDFVIEPSDDTNPNVFRFRANSQNAAAGLRVLDRYESDYISLRHDGAVGVIETDSDGGNIYISPQGSVAITATTSGNVGIGTTSPASKLHIAQSTSTVNELYITQQKTYGTGTGTSERAAIVLGISESGIAFSDRKFAVIETGTESESSSANSFLAISTRVGGGVNERMRITSGGNVGIGTTAPNNKLDVRRATSGIVAEFHSTAGTADEYVDVKLISGNTTSGTYGTILRHQRVGTSGADFAILTNPTLTGTPVERFRITRDGKLGVGTTSPISRIDVGSSAANAKIVIGTYVASNFWSGIGMDSSDAGVRIAGDMSAATSRLVDVGFYSNDANHDWTSRLKVVRDGTVTISGYGAGLLQTDANGVVSLDTTAYLPSSSYVAPAIEAGGGTPALATGVTAGEIRTLIDVDQAGTDNSTNVTLAGSYDYLTLSGQEITLGQVDYSTDISNLPTLGTAAAAAATDFVAVTGDEMSGDLSIIGANKSFIVGEDANNVVQLQWNDTGNHGKLLTREAGTYYDNTIVLKGGNVSVGNTSPSAKFHVSGNKTILSEYGNTSHQIYTYQITTPTSTSSSQVFDMYLGRFGNGYHKISLWGSGYGTDVGNYFDITTSWGAATPPKIISSGGFRIGSATYTIHYVRVDYGTYDLFIKYASSMPSGYQNTITYTIQSNTGSGYTQFQYPGGVTIPTLDGTNKVASVVTFDYNNTSTSGTTIHGTFSLSNYGAGYLKTDASGNVSVDTDTIEDTLQSVTTRGSSTTTTMSTNGGKLVFRDDSIENHVTNGNAAIVFNYYGYGTGTTQFRDTIFYDGKNSAVMFVDGSAGSVGIGNTTPSEKLDVSGNIKTSGVIYVSATSSTALTPAANDWIDIAEMPYGECHGKIAFEWNSLTAPSSAHHGWVEIEVGTYYSASFNYGQDTYVEVTKALAHNDFWLSAARAVDYGSTVRIQVQVARAVTAGTFRSFVLHKNQGTVTSLTPAINNNAYTVLALANVGEVDGEYVQKAIGNRVRFSKSVAFDEKVGVGTTSPGSPLTVAGAGGSTKGTNGYLVHIGGTDSNIDPVRYMIGFSHGNTYTAGNVRAAMGSLITQGGKGNLVFETGASGAGQAERMRINGDGNVGIGTSDPQRSLHISKASGDTLIRANAPTGSYSGLELTENESTTSSTYWQINKVPTDHRLQFWNGSERITVLAGGNVGIGTTTANTLLSIDGKADDGISIQGIGTTATRAFFGLDTSGDGYLSLTNAGTFTKNVQLTSDLGVANYIMGNVGIGTTNPGAKLTAVGTIQTSRTTSESENLLFYTQATAKWGSSTYPGVIESYGNNSFIIGSGQNVPLHLARSGAIALTIGTGGNVGIGTTNPTYKLDVSGETRTNSALYISADNLTGYVASRIRMLSHNNYRGAGMFLQGVDTNWFVGAPYTDFSGGFIIAKKASGTADDDTAQYSNALFTVKSSGNVGIGTTTPATKLHVVGTAETRLRVGSSNATSNVVLELRDENTPTGQGTVITYNNATGETYFNNALSTATTDFHFQSGEYGTANDFFTLSNSGGNSIVHLSTTTGDSFITYEDATNELAIASDGDLRLTTPTDQDVFFISSGGNIDMTQAGGNVDMGGNLTVDGNITGNGSAYITGSLGIGTSSPSQKLDIVDGILRFTNTTSGRNSTIGMDNNYDFYVKNTALGNLYLGNGTTTYVNGHLNVDSGSLYVNNTTNSVGIGTTAPQQLLHIKGATSAYIMLEADSDTGTVGTYYKTEDTDDTMNRTKGFFGWTGQTAYGNGYFTMWLDTVEDNGAVTSSEEKFRWERDGDFHADGDVIAYSTTTPSDERLKDNIKTIENASEKIAKMRGVEYQWNTGKLTGKKEIGLIAQEVEAVVPEVVAEKKLPMLTGTDEVYKTVDYERLVALLIESNKELQNRITELESKVYGTSK